MRVLWCLPENTQKCTHHPAVLLYFWSFPGPFINTPKQMRQSNCRKSFSGNQDTYELLSKKGTCKIKHYVTINCLLTQSLPLCTILCFKRLQTHIDTHSHRPWSVCQCCRYPHLKNKTKNTWLASRGHLGTEGKPAVYIAHPSLSENKIRIIQLCIFYVKSIAWFEDGEAWFHTF